MREMVRLFIVIFIFSGVSGGLLAALHGGTKERIEYQELIFVKGPAIKSIMEGASNDPLEDRFKLTDGSMEREFYVGKFDGNANIVAFETFGKGYEGDVGVIVAVNVESDEILGIGVTTNSETPGVGKRIETDMDFRSQFKGLSIQEPHKIRPDGGQIDAISGASFSSRGVAEAVNSAENIYKRLKKGITEQLKAFQS